MLCAEYPHSVCTHMLNIRWCNLSSADKADGVACNAIFGAYFLNIDDWSRGEVCQSRNNCRIDLGSGMGGTGFLL